MRGNMNLNRNLVILRKFQFTPLHERQRYLRESEQQVKPISIHASTWEATIERRRKGLGKPISIHASTWEATVMDANGNFRDIFQFTPLHERQQVACIQPPAPVLYFNSRLYMRGNKQGWYDESLKKFQFTPLHERQPYCDLMSKDPNTFQFTPLHERQQIQRWFRRFFLYFNSRLYMRGNRNWRSSLGGL